MITDVRKCLFAYVISTVSLLNSRYLFIMSIIHGKAEWTTRKNRIKSELMATELDSMRGLLFVLNFDCFLTVSLQTNKVKHHFFRNMQEDLC